MASTEAQKRASMKWSKKNVKTFTISLRIGEDDAIIDKLQRQQNRTEYIRDLVRKDINEPSK